MRGDPPSRRIPLGTRVRLLAVGLAALWIGAIYVALLALDSAPPTPLNTWAARGLYALAFLMPVALPLAATWIRRATGEETERFIRAERAASPGGDARSGHVEMEWISIIRGSPLPMAIFDRELRYIAHSDRWITAYRLTEPSLIGRYHYDVFPEVPGRWKVLHRQCLAGETKHSAGERFPRADGRVDWIRWTVQPWFTAEGEVGGVVMLTEVITAQKEAELALSARLADLETAWRRLDAAADVAGLGYWTWYPDTGEFDASARLLQILDVPPGTPISFEAFVEHILPEERPIMVARVRRAVERGASFSHQAQLAVGGSVRLVRLAGRVERGPESKLVGVVTEVVGEELPDAVGAGPRRP